MNWLLGSHSSLITQNSSVRRAVVEAAGEAAAAVEIPAQGAVVHGHVLDEQLRAGLVVAGDTAGDGLLAPHGGGGGEGDEGAGAGALAAGGVVELDAGGAHGKDLAEGGGEVLESAAAGAAEVDGGEGVLLLRGGALVEVEGYAPGGALPGVGEAAGEDDAQAGEVQVAGAAALDPPGEGEVAL